MTRTVGPTEVGEDEARRCLSAGGIVALPTDTLYGMAVRADDTRAVSMLYQLKGRPTDKAMVALVGAIEQARMLVEFDEDAERLAAEFWPGPLTIVAPFLDRVCSAARAGLPTLGVRWPKQASTERILCGCEFPVVAPSANLAGEPPCKTAKRINDLFRHDVALIVDGGKVLDGPPSTIVELPSKKLLREGAISLARLQAVVPAIT